MSPILGTVRENIQAQGFCGLDDKTSAQLNYPLRMSPAILQYVGSRGYGARLTHYSLGFGAICSPGRNSAGHPFDVFYNYGLRHLFGTPALPRYGARRRFACALATIMVIAAAWGFQAGMPLVGYIVGWSLVAAAFVNVSTGFCIPSFIVRMFFGKVVLENKSAPVFRENGVMRRSCAATCARN